MPTAKPSRRFELVDAIILVAASAVGAMSIRPCLLYGPGMLGFITEYDPSARYSVYPSMILEFVQPWLASLTVALLIIRLRRSRLRFSRLVRQPGMAACIAATAIIVAHVLSAAMAMAFVGTPPGPENFYVKVLMPIFSGVGTAVSAVWLIMMLTRTWRPEPGWVDRTGRLLGGCWIVVFLVMTWSSFWITAVTSRIMGPPPPTAAQIAAEEAQIAAEEAQFAQKMAIQEQELLKAKQRNDEAKQRNDELKKKLRELELEEQKQGQKPTQIKE